MIEQHQSELDDVIRQLRDLQAEYDAKVQELQVTEAELDTQKEANARAPTKTMKDLVERLKNQLSLKEKQHQVQKTLNILWLFFPKYSQQTP